MDCEAFAKCVHRCTKWTKQEAGVILTTIFLVFLIRTICIVVASDANQPLSTAIGVTSRSSFCPSNTEVNSSIAGDDERAVIKEAFITGTDAVKRFRSHLQCFSESGKWVYDPMPRHLPWNYIGDAYVGTCDGKYIRSGNESVAYESAEDIALRGAPGNWSVREVLKWVWQTNSSCPWRPVDRDEFCRKIGSKGNIMVVGDSINHEISWAVMNALIQNHHTSKYENLDASTRFVFEPYEMCSDIFGEGNGINVSFVRNDRLSPIVNDTVDTWNNFYEFPWVDILGQLGIKTLLLNRGAHYEDDMTYTNALHKIFTILSLHYPHIKVIYRNTPPGHLDCMNFTRPLLEIQHGLPLEYHWDDFNRQNLLAKRIVEDFHYTYMDVYSMLSLRADGHIYEKDCLHYCLPGPLDIVVEHLYNILLLI
ncbi:unnamed protein product [Calypogeia fissa]